jgi:hypothetical protein
MQDGLKARDLLSRHMRDIKFSGRKVTTTGSMQVVSVGHSHFRQLFPGPVPGNGLVACVARVLMALPARGQREKTR